MSGLTVNSVNNTGAGDGAEKKVDDIAKTEDLNPVEKKEAKSEAGKKVKKAKKGSVLESISKALDLAKDVLDLIEDLHDGLEKHDVEINALRSAARQFVHIGTQKKAKEEAK